MHRTAALALVLIVLGSGCASTRRRLEVNSVPTGATVITSTGETIGQTPLVLEDNAIDKTMEAGRVNLTLDLPNYLQRQIVVEAHAEESINVKLSKYDEDYFSARLIKDFPQQANAMVRELLRLQGLVLLKRLDQAAKGLDDFSRKYPSVGASYVMLANIAQLQGNLRAAEKFLMRARTVDPSDPVIDRTLNQLGTRSSR